jgi:hypothetical protein
VLRKSVAQRAALVVVPRDQVIRHRQRREKRLQRRVLLRLAEVHQVACDEEDIRALLQRADMLDAPREHPGRVDHAVRELPVRLDVQVGDLADQHRYPLAFEREQRLRLHGEQADAAMTLPE